MSNPPAALAGSGFVYRDGELHAEALTLSDIARQIGTPFYCYSGAALATQYRRYEDAFAGQRMTICYAVKANPNLAVIRRLALLGAGADVVSEGELRRALAAGVPAERIVFSGIGKTTAEMQFAIAQGIHQINVESEPELLALSQVASAMGRVAPIVLRVNPDVDARTHAKIATGRSENKFGIDVDHVPGLAQRAAGLPGIAFQGLAIHIGSQLTQLAPFRDAFTRLAQLVRDLGAAGIPVTRLDLGGGLGITYRDEEPPPIADYAALIGEIFGPFQLDLAIEPGRSLVGNAGVLVSSVLYLKEGLTRRFLILDAAMNDLIRPALYEAWHEIVPVREAAQGSEKIPVDVVGPVCETGDTFAQQRRLPPLAPGDLVAILSAGAYGSAMSSTYNSRPLVPEVLVEGERFAIVRKRPDYEDMLAQEMIPPWLKEPR